MLATYDTMVGDSSEPKAPVSCVRVRVRVRVRVIGLGLGLGLEP